MCLRQLDEAMRLVVNTAVFLKTKMITIESEKSYDHWESNCWVFYIIHGISSSCGG